jgi:hypothetical protein
MLQKWGCADVGECWLLLLLLLPLLLLPIQPAALLLLLLPLHFNERIG